MASLRAQVLARPGWAGSGVTTETWWHAAVFYRVDPARFQDSDGNGSGDLAGIAARLDYLQSLGIDAVVLDGRYDPGGIEGLVRSASQHGIRVLLTVTPQAQGGDRKLLLSNLHEWLGEGVAGLWLRQPESSGGAGMVGYASLVSDLRGLLRMFPGERVLLSDPVPLDGSGAEPSGSRRRAGGSVYANAHDGLLTTAAELPVERPDAAALRQALLGVADGSSSGALPLLGFARDPGTASPEAAVAAAVLLASRGAVLFDFGDEIGLDTFPVPEAAAHVVLPVMQWTPANVEEAPKVAPVERVAPVVRPGETPFGPYRPYIHPPPQRLTGPDPALPHVALDTNIPAPLPAPDTLPGFTTGHLPVQPVDRDAVNVATENRDPHSVLNAYRQMIALRHGNATLRNGAQVVLNRDAQDAVVWIRRASAGSRTVGDVIVAANLGDHPVTLSLDGDLARLRVRSGALRALFTFSPAPLTGENTGSLQLPPHAVFMGEVYRP